MLRGVRRDLFFALFFFFLQLLVSFDFLKSILDDAIDDMKMIFKLDLKIIILDTFYEKTICYLFQINKVLFDCS